MLSVRDIYLIGSELIGKRAGIGEVLHLIAVYHGHPPRLDCPELPPPVGPEHGVRFHSSCLGSKTMVTG
eukprot:scaffold493244_cov22-Prasinocladus_malaysianus.AAC.1